MILRISSSVNLSETSACVTCSRSAASNAASQALPAVDETTEERQRPSIAVLPFTGLSAAPEQGSVRIQSDVSFRWRPPGRDSPQPPECGQHRSVDKIDASDKLQTIESSGVR